VNVELFGQLAQGTQRHQSLTLDRPMKVREVASLLEIDTEHIGLIAIDNVQCELDDWVSPDCRLCFFPPMSGG
jgi:molybdopterin converting factor small subunit